MGPRQIWALLAMDQLANPSTRRKREAGSKRLQGLNKPQPCQLAQVRALSSDFLKIIVPLHLNGFLLHIF